MTHASLIIVHGHDDSAECHESTIEVDLARFPNTVICLPMRYIVFAKTDIISLLGLHSGLKELHLRSDGKHFGIAVRRERSDDLLISSVPESGALDQKIDHQHSG